MSLIGTFRPTLPRTARKLGYAISDLNTDAVGGTANGTTSALSRLPTKTLLRSLFLTSLMTKGWIMTPALAVMQSIAKPRSMFWDPDRNPILNRVLRWSIYNHFCAGRSEAEVRRSIDDTNKLGYGIILGFAKEIVLNASAGGIEFDGHKYSSACYEMIDEWKAENLRTLKFLKPGDYLSVKITGAGPIAVDALRANQPMPPAISEAMNEICEATSNQKSLLWLDAEQQVLQKCLDDWVIELMRRHNKNGALVYNTIQAYLKGAKANVERHITLAAQEGWTLGVKLVRGAYIEHEIRSLIHDNKDDTDRSYDLIADMFISQKMPPGANSTQFPASCLFLGTHNAPSAERAFLAHHRRVVDGLATTTLECGQVTGMADELSCQLLECHSQFSKVPGLDQSMVPSVYKYLIWGSVAECMGYLHRRAIENRGAVARTRHMVDSLKRELYRRLFK